MQNRLGRLLSYSDEHRSAMKSAAIYSVINKFFDVFPEILLGVAIDVVVKRDESFLADIGIVNTKVQLALLAFATLVVWVCESLSEYQAVVRWRNIAQEMQHKLRIHGASHIQKLSMSWYGDQNSGQLMAVLNDDVNQVERFLNDGLHTLIQLFVSSILIAFVFFYLSPLVAFFAILPIPIIIFGGFKLKGPLTGHYAEVRGKAANLSEKLSGVIGGVTTIRAAVAEKAMVDTITKASEDYIVANRKAIKMSSAFVPIIRMAVLAGFLITLVVGGLQSLDGELSAAAFTMMVFLTQRLLWPFTRFGELIDLYERSLASAGRVFSLLSEKAEIVSPKNPQNESGAIAEVELNAVDFSYTGASKKVLSSLDLKIAAGEFVGIVGPTGSGKSTIIKLLMRFYDADSGTVKVGNTDVKQWDLSDLRRFIGFVGQDVFLMDASVRENLKLGKDHITDDEIWEALEVSDAASFVKELPGQLDFALGERGGRLSGGQRQRLTIARGILGDPPLLIFDEATSAVDNESEESIQKSVTTIAQAKTLIVIAHRLSTIRGADKIVVMDEGKISEAGKHDELVAKDGLYARLWRLQTGER